MQDSSGIGIVDEIFFFWLGSELGLPLWDLLDSDTWPHVGLQLIVKIPPGSNVRYHELMVSLSQDTLAVTPSGYFPKFPPPPSGTRLTYPL